MLRYVISWLTPLLVKVGKVMQESRRKYYWLICKDPETKKVFLIAGGSTEEEARQKGLEMLSGIDFRIEGLPTRNLQTASSIIRGKRLEDTHSLQRARERIGHSKSIERYKRKQRREELI